MPYTPGPWICYADTPRVSPNWRIVTNKSRMRIVCNIHLDPGNKMDSADAALIVASPDIHAALLSVAAELDRAEVGYGHDAEITLSAEEVAAIRAALARATAP